MAVCQYFGQVDCSPPVIDGGSAAGAGVASTPFPLNVLGFLFGTSPLTWLLSCLVYFLLLRFIIWPLILAPLLDWLDFRRQKTVTWKLIELTPPRTTATSAEAAEELFSVLHYTLSQQSFSEYVLRRKQLVSFEIVSSRELGIRFLVRLPEQCVTLLTQLVSSHMPDVHFSEAPDYIDGLLGKRPAALIEFAQQRPFIYPLRSQALLNHHDPLVFITGAMTQPAREETVALQLVMSTYDPKQQAKMQKRIWQKKEPLLRDMGGHGALLLVKRGFVVIAAILRVSLWFGSFVLFIVHKRRPRLPQRGNTWQDASRRGVLPPAHEGQYQGVYEKLAEPLFYVDMRAYVAASNQQRLESRLQGLIGTLAAYGEIGYQQLLPNQTLAGLLLKKLLPRLGQLHEQYRLLKFSLRLPSLMRFHSLVLSSSEVAGLYHFPYQKAVGTENIERALSKALPAPAVMKQRMDTHAFDVVLGVNRYHGSDTTIGLTQPERERHMYIVGGTGHGKTTMLQYMIAQDMRAGKGVAVVDPHGDLAEELLAHVPPERVSDVIYFNPFDTAHPIGLNLLELPEGTSEADMEKDFVTETIVSMFRKTFSEDDSGGHRIETVLRNTIRTAFYVPDATLFTLYDLLTNKAFRAKTLAQVSDKRLTQFWINEFGQAGSMQRVKMSAGVTAKLGRFDGSIAVRKVFEQPHSTIDFDDIIDSGKILICNFAKGRLGEDTSELFGIAVLAKLQLAALRRARLAAGERRPFYLYVDEFQQFATPSFMQLLSEARKYRLFLTMAEQSTRQQRERRLISIILDNVGTVVSFRVRADSERLLLPLFQPYLAPGEIANLPSFTFFVRVAGLEAYEPMSGETLLESKGSEDIAEQVIASSQNNFSSRTHEKETLAPYLAPNQVSKGDKQERSADSGGGLRSTDELE